MDEIISQTIFALGHLAGVKKQKALCQRDATIAKQKHLRFRWKQADKKIRLSFFKELF